MSVLPPFEHVRPTTLDEALALIGEDSLPYVGGTELLVAMRAGLLRPARLVDLKHVAGMSAVATTDDIVIGAAVTHRSAARHPAVRERLPALATVLESVGNPRIRAAGTLAGNLCFAEPKSDVATISLALDATVTLQSPRGSRILGIGEFVLGPYFTDREDDELLTEINYPADVVIAAVYEKFQTMERPTVGVAATLRADGARTAVVGAVGGAPTTFVDPDPEDVAAAVEVIPDLTGSEAYKRHLVKVMVRRALDRLAEAA